jgi:hypothetical protein
VFGAQDSKPNEYLKTNEMVSKIVLSFTTLMLFKTNVSKFDMIYYFI